MLRGHPILGYALSALLALGAVVALLGAHGLVAAVLGVLAWFALPDAREGGPLVAVQRSRRTARRAVRL